MNYAVNNFALPFTGVDCHFPKAENAS